MCQPIRFPHSIALKATVSSQPIKRLHDESSSKATERSRPIKRLHDESTSKATESSCTGEDWRQGITVGGGMGGWAGSTADLKHADLADEAAAATLAGLTHLIPDSHFPHHHYPHKSQLPLLLKGLLRRGPIRRGSEGGQGPIWRGFIDQV
eukprot:6873537-Pyramimonas_sp.AAC.2